LSYFTADIRSADACFNSGLILQYLYSGRLVKLIITSHALQEWMRVLLTSRQKKVMQGIIAVLGDTNTSLRCKENAAWILRRVTELSDTAKTLFAGPSPKYCFL